MLRLVSSVPEFFAHGGREAVERGEGYGCTCGRCGREIAAPLDMQGRLIWCLYCGMESGYVPMIDVPWGHRWSFGVTLDECREDLAALEQGVGAFERLSEARARRNGQVIDLFE